MLATPSSPAFPYDIDEMARRVQSAGYRFNDERQAVILALSQASEPLDAEGVWSAARHMGSRIHRATTYRNVALFARLGIIEIAAVPRGRKAYQLKRHSPSVHLVRVDTGAIQEVTDASLLAALIEVVQRHGYQLSGGVELRVKPLA